MIYLTNDSHDQAIYFDLRKQEPRRKAGVTEHWLYGLLGNGVAEVPVTLRQRQDWVEVNFGGSALFDFIEERTIRRMLGEMAMEMALH